MFDRDEELNNIMTFKLQDIVKATLQTLDIYGLKGVRMKLDPHYSDSYNPSLDSFFTSTTCKLCGDTHIINRKEHFHYRCKAVKDARDRATDLEEFECVVNSLLRAE